MRDVKFDKGTVQLHLQCAFLPYEACAISYRLEGPAK